jgi:hypothetical protein
MPIFEIQGPDGKIYEADAPDAQTAARAFSQMANLDTSRPTLDPAMVQRAHQRASDSLAPPSLSLGDVAEGVAENWKDSAVNLGNSLIQPFAHPINTAVGLADLANGLVSKVMPADAESWTLGRQQPSKPADEAKAEREASVDTLWEHGKDRFGSWEGFKRATATDPFGVAADVGMVLSGGGGAAARLPGLAGKAGEIVRATGRAIDPVANVTRAATGIADVTLPKGASKLKDVPTGDELKAAGRAAYQSADDAGVIVAQPALKQLHAQIADDLAEFGYKPELYPKVRAALDDIEDLANARVKGTPEKMVGLERFDPAGQSAPVHTTLKGLEQTRRLVGNAGKSIEPSERLLGAKIADRIDEFMDRLDQPGMTIMGDAAKGAAALKEARGLWHQARKAELIDNAIEGAKTRAASTGSGTNVENAIRQDLRKLLTNRKTARAFSKEEKNAIMRVIRGTASQNVLRGIGKMAPSGIVSGGLSATASAAIFSPVLGPAGAAVLPAAGFAAKQAADRGTRLQAEALHKAALGGQIAKAAPRQAPVGAAQVGYQVGDATNEEEQKRRLREILMRRAAADRGQ